MVADYAVGPFVHKCIGVGCQLYQRVFIGAAQEIHSGECLVVAHPLLEPHRNAFLDGYGCNAFRQHAVGFAFVHGELAQGEECPSRLGGYPVGVASACVKQGIGCVFDFFVGRGDDAALEFERRESGQLGVRLCLLFVHYQREFNVLCAKYCQERLLPVAGC